MSMCAVDTAVRYLFESFVVIGIPALAAVAVWTMYLIATSFQENNLSVSQNDRHIIVIMDP